MKTNKITISDNEKKILFDKLRKASFDFLKEKRPDLLEHELNSYFLEDRTPTTIHLKFDLAIGEIKKE